MAACGGDNVAVGPAALEAALASSLHHRRVRNIVVQELAPLLTVAATAPYGYPGTGSISQVRIRILPFSKIMLAKEDFNTKLRRKKIFLRQDNL